MSAEAPPLLRVEGLEKRFRELRAVGGVDFDVRPGETFGLVGESGCGKSTIARCVLRLIEPSAGTVAFDGLDVRSLSAGELRALRRRMQLVFQDPTGSLDPRMSVGAIVEEPLRIHAVGSREQRAARVAELLALVGLDPAVARRRPHEFSGGQRQRVGIARAIALEPELVVLDEPVSALDVSIQAQVLNLLQELQRRLGLTYLFIVHDLAVAEHFCDRLAVLYLGRVMEIGTREQLFRAPQHPYTVALLSAVPVPDPDPSRRRRRITLEGEVGAPPPAGAAQGCPFRARCPVGRDRDVCRDIVPPLAPHGAGQRVACHFPGELTAAAG